MEIIYIYIVFVSFVFAIVICIDIFNLTKNIKKDKYVETDKDFAPKALVIIPIKNIDFGLEQNLKSIASQNYPKYDVIAVADTLKDPAVAFSKRAKIKAIATANRKWPKNCSGKNRAIVSALIARPQYKVYVIADSDIRVKKDWLKNLIAPLSESGIGVATTFPIIIPANNDIWSKVKMQWGLVGQSLLNNERTRFAWGGSLAFKRELIDERLFYLLTRSKYRISDDISITKRAKELKKRIAYVKNAAPETMVKESRGSFFEWANRQTALTLLGYRRNLQFGLAYYSAELLLTASGILLALAVNPLFVVFLSHLIISEYRAFSRTPKTYAVTAAITIAMPGIYLYNLIKAAKMKEIVWRGKTYRLSTPG
ncbi:MAG: glycosyltransferase family 2 protein [Candidatus Micrarchaeaceae archaeon]